MRDVEITPEQPGKRAVRMRWGMTVSGNSRLYVSDCGEQTGTSSTDRFVLSKEEWVKVAHMIIQLSLEDQMDEA